MKQASCLVAVLAFVTHSALGQSPEPQLTDRAAVRFLEQATWGLTPADIDALKQLGIQKWLSAQFTATPSDLPDVPVLGSDGKPNLDLTPIDTAFFQNAINNPDQLRQRVAFALSEIWVVSRLDVGYAYAIPPYWRVLRDHAFDNYRTIIRAVTLNPGMGSFLNMVNNVKANPAKGTTANENYAREIMQLFTMGLTKLNIDGSPVLDSNGNPLPTYTQDDVSALAKVFTGWTYPTAPGAQPKPSNPSYFFGEMIPYEPYHDTSAKVLFGSYQIPANQKSSDELDMAIDILMEQDSVAPFVSKQLIEHLVTSNPRPDYVTRVAQVFRNNGSGVVGDMKAVITAILADPDARAFDDPSFPFVPEYGHLKEPVLFLTNVLRALRATVSDTTTVASRAASMGQNLFLEPSVFSYFSPQYRTEGGLLGPEFQLYTTATAPVRANLINAALYSQLDKGTALDLSDFVNAAATSLNTLLSRIDWLLLHQSMSGGLQQAALSAAQAATTPAEQAKAALYVVLTSAEYNIIH
jgi:uncharacterized protein (DUF1800 family)